MSAPSVLYRFSSHARLTAFVKEGRISFNHARNFTAGELLPGQRDNEQERLFHPDAQNLQMAVQSPGKEAAPISNLTNVKITLNLPDRSGNPLGYYLLCCSSENNPRMFDEFGADAVVEIRDAQAFFDRLQAAVREQIPGFDCVGRTVEYFDRNSLPHKTMTSEYLFCKDAAFAYQREVRFILIGPPEKSGEDRKEVIVGPLEDQCVIHPR